MKKLYAVLLTLAIVFPLGTVAESRDVRSAAERFTPQYRDATQIAQERRDLYRTDELVVRFKSDERFKRVRISPRESVTQALGRFRQDPDILYAEPNYIAYALFIPNDPYYNYQWHFDNDTYGGVEAESAWDTGNGSGAVVAIVDTGIAYEDNGFWYRQAPDLAETCFVSGYDFVNDDTHPNDDNAHGTHVAGTVAQSTNNALGVAGLAHGACLMPVKVLDSRGSGTYADVADGIRFAADNGADVINLSLGGPSPATYLEEAIAYAHDKGVTIVAAAGNDNSSSISYPAAYDDYVIAVGATRFDETRAYYSNYGASLDLVAPGGDINVDQNGDGYGDGVLQQTFGSRTTSFGYYFYQGTSMATPHVAAVAAMVIAEGVAEAPSDVRAALEGSADDLGASGWDGTYGHGLVNAAAALGSEPAPPPPPPDNPPSVSITAPAHNETVLGTVTVSADATDDNGVAEVNFYVNGTLIATDTTAPYETPWDSTTVSDDNHTITAEAVDTISQTADDSVTVLVDNINDSPTADAGSNQTVSDDDGSGAETVALDGSGSSDSDGSSTAYEWREGATLLGTDETFNHEFIVGDHTITLTITDDDGATDSDDVLVRVLANQPPQADAGGDTTANIGESVAFNGSGSSDPDGSIALYEWDFGDGETATGVSVSHTYDTAGDYTATLTVTDNGGLSDSDTALVSITEESEEEPPPSGTVFSESFESGLGAWTQDSQNDWFRSSQRATNGNYSAEVDGRALDAELISPTISLGGASNANVAFSWFIESTLDWFEYIAFDVSTNGGSSWVEYARLDGNIDQENVWHEESIDIVGTSELVLRFRGKMSSGNEDANVDDITVTAW